MRQHALRQQYISITRTRRGLGMIEVLAALFIFSLLLTGMMTVTSAVSRVDTRMQAESPMANAARVTIDEVSQQLRGASSVLSSFSSGSTTYSTTSSSVALKLPSFNPAYTNPLIASTYDYIAYNYSSATQTLQETIVAGCDASSNCSVRPNRSAFTLVKNVSAVTFTYNVREVGTASVAGSNTFTLTGTPTTSLPVVTVNGVKLTTGTSYNATTKVLTVLSLTIGDNVQIVYPISPTSAADLSLVTEVNLSLTISDTDGLANTRSVTMPGSGRLRNLRI